MKSYLVIVISFFIAACSTNQPQVSQNSNANSQPPMRAEKLESTTAHTTENQPPKSSDTNGGKWSAGGEPIDTTKFDGVIAEADKAAKAKPNDEAAKKNLAQAYFDRGYALTEARQYAAAIGDYRRALKYDPDHEESKKWIGEISRIYQMLKKEAPKEGEEPAPLQFKKS
jgi:tetratricopeptide (TPR) repeat protein